MFLKKAIGFILGFVALSNAVSFAINPWIIVLEPQNNVLSQVLTLKYVGDEVKDQSKNSTNPQGTAPIPVELSILARIVDENGEVKYPNTKPAPEFTLFPSQVILYPGDEQKVQLQWVSDKLPNREVTYGLIAAQLPVNIEEGGKKYTRAVGQVTILTRYEAIVVVRPAGTKPKIMVDSAFAWKDSGGVDKMVLVLSNQGTGMQSAKDMKLNVIPVGNNGKADFKKKLHWTPELPSRLVKNAIFSGGKRRLILSWPEKLPIGPIQVSPEFP